MKSIVSGRSPHHPGITGGVLRAFALRLASIVLLCGLSQAAVHRSQAWADTHYAKAEAQRIALNAKSPESRSRREYEAAIGSYRLVVLGAPTSTKADGSAFAVAELTAEMGRLFKDVRAMYSAVREYKFLRKGYPGSKHRIAALLAVGEIYQNDLNDNADARLTFEEFLRRYPRSDLLKQARADLEVIGTQDGSSAAGVGEEAKAGDASAHDSKPENTSENASATSSDRVPQGNDVRVTDLQYWSGPDYTRVTIGLQQGVEFDAKRLSHPDRIFFDLKNAEVGAALTGQSYDVDDGLVKKIRVAQYRPGRARVVVETDGHARYEASLLMNPPRLVIDLRGNTVRASKSRVVSPKEDQAGAANARASNIPSAENEDGSDASLSATVKPASSTASDDGVKRVVVEADDEDTSKRAGDSSARAKSATDIRTPRRVTTAKMHESQPTADGDRSLIRALGLKISKIVIDPGHGGHDTGTIGPGGLYEKDLVLDVSKRLGKLLETRLGADVVYTRHDDTFIPLETRTEIANQDQADLFISVHANSSHDPDARGVETYYLNFTSSPDALEVAARENADSDKSIHELQDLVKKIALKEKIEESREFASDVEESLHSGLAARSPGERDRGVKKAPFVVLIGANMPSILAEISFISNPGDERRLRTPAYRQRIAEALYRGIARYVNGLGGVKLASGVNNSSGN